MSNGATVQHAYDADGNRVKTVATSPIPCSGNSAAYVRTDSATQGNWQGTYGGDGQYINAEPATPPAYGSLTYDGTRNFTWAATTSDVRGLEAPAPQTSRIASTWYTTSTETFHVVTTDQNEHTIALYFLDWDGTNHTQSVTAKTPSGTALDSNRGFSGYTGGQYAVYTVCGSVDFAVSLTSGASAVVSGVFFGTPGQAPRVTNMLVDSGGGLSQVVEETDGSNSPTALYVRAGDQLLAVMRPGGSGGMWTTHFVHEDGLGSVRTITDETGTVVDTRGYEAFGTKNSEAGSETLAYGFAGEPFDSTTNLAYHRARWMDSRVGRFTGMDRFAGDAKRPVSLHRYLYAANNSTNWLDPSGLDNGAGLSFSAILSYFTGTPIAPKGSFCAGCNDPIGNAEAFGLGDVVPVGHVQAQLDAYACALAASPNPLGLMIQNSKGDGPFDFIGNGVYAMFTLPAIGGLSPGTVRSKDYGNYLAGFAAGFIDSSLALFIVQAGGSFYEQTDRAHSPVLPPAYGVPGDKPDYGNLLGDDPIGAEFIAIGENAGEVERAEKFHE